MYHGAIEAGGTKMVCAVGTDTGEIIDKIYVMTKTPEETIPEMTAFFQRYDIKTLGIGTFGPVELARNSKKYGCILKSPKKQWEGFNFYSHFYSVFKCPVVVDTDVNVAAYGEYCRGALKDIDNGMYLTIGTGIGAGIIVDGRLIHGMMHPEAGHIILARYPGDNMRCNCRFHNNCFEGMAAGPTLMERTGIRGEHIPEIHPVWETESYYIAQALVNYTLTLSTQRIVLGGGVMEQEHLFPKIRMQFKKLMGGYMDTKELNDMESFIVPPELDGEQGIVGAMLLGMKDSCNN